jgi:tRNA 2-selenouridine synthase
MSITIEDFIYSKEDNLIIDVRSPSEYSQAHIPGAKNLPLFTDEERVVVGTLYKKKSREDAMKQGMQYFGARMHLMVIEIETWLKDKESKNVYLHCWRGGMRSGAVSWLLNFYGINTVTLQGGYKAYRQWVLAQFEKRYDLHVIKGYTGSGKTSHLYKLKQEGRSVIDLEVLARHKGSAFGHINQPEQPSQEMFENELCLQLYLLSKENKPIYLEDESKHIGKVFLPPSLWAQMQVAPSTKLEVSKNDRLENIFKEYGQLNNNALIEAILRIQKRLGGKSAQDAISFITQGNNKAAFEILLNYYDRWYDKNLVSK